MDGTLTLSEELHYEAFAQVFNEYGVKFTLEEEVNKYAGAGAKLTFETVLKEHGISATPEEIEKCIAKKRELYTKIVQNTEIQLVDGAKEFVIKVHNLGLKKIIATGNSDISSVSLMLKKTGLEEFFPDILTIKEVAHGKPFPDVFLEAARRMGCLPEECVVFEDASNGVSAARAAKIRCIALETTTPKKLLEAAGATVVIKNYYQLTDAILYGS